MRAFKKFCNWAIKKNGNVTNYTLFFNVIPTEFNAFATFFSGRLLIPLK